MQEVYLVVETFRRYCKAEPEGYVSTKEKGVITIVRLCYSLVIPLLSLWVIANAETMIGQEFFQLVYVFEFLIETHWSNPYVGELSEFSFERNFPRVTEER